MRLRDVHPEDFLRAGALLGVVSEEVGDAIGRARSCAEVRWVGRPNQRYQERLRDLSRDLARVRTSFDDAGAVLVAYAHSLGVVRELALEADLLEAQAQDLVRDRQRRDWHDDLDGTAVSSLVVTPQEQALLDRARLLQTEASEISEAASRRVAARLHELADQAMRVEGWQSFNRGVARAAEGFSGVVSANVILAGDAFQSLPGVGDERSRTAAREELWAAGAAVVQPWLAVEDLIGQLQDGDYARTAGEAAGVLILKGHGGKRDALFGAHNAMPLEVLSTLKGFERTERFVLEHAQQTFFRQLQHFAKLPAPTVKEMLRDGVDLVQQEALGGHTLIKHVGRDLDFLGKRQLAETKPGRELRTMSSFSSQEEAELAVHRALAVPENADELRDWAASAVTEPLRLKVAIQGMGVVRNQQGTKSRTAFAIIEFAKDARGRVLLNSAFLDWM